MSTFFTLLLAVYCFVVQFGSLFRYGSSEVAGGVSTILALLIIVMGITRIPSQLRNIPVLWGFTILFGWISLSSALSPTGVLDAYKSLAILVLYLCLAGSVSSIQFTEKQLRFISYAVTIGLLLSSGLTIIDFQGWAQVPGCNERIGATKVEGFSTEYIYQAAGFFPRSSAMAAVFSLSITMSAILALSTKNWISKTLYASAALSGCVSMLLSHNRSGMVAVAFGLITYLFLSNILTFSTRIKVAVIGSLLSVAFLYIATTYYPEHVDVYRRKFAFLIPGADKGDYTESQRAADSVRIDNLKTAFKSLGENPFGNGFGMLSHRDFGIRDAHNIYIALLWAGGIFTLAWTVPFGIAFLKLMFAKVPLVSEALPYFDAIRFSLIAFLFNNMAHNALATGFFWMFLASLISIKYLGIVGTNPVYHSGYQQLPFPRRANTY